MPGAPSYFAGFRKSRLAFVRFLRGGGAGTDPDSLYITAGPEGETRGVFAQISVDTGGGGGGTAIPIPPALFTAPLAGVLALASARRWRHGRAAH